MITFTYRLCFFGRPSVYLTGDVKGGIHRFRRENPLKGNSILLPTELKIVQLRAHQSPPPPSSTSFKILRHKEMKETCVCPMIIH